MRSSSAAKLLLIAMLISATLQSSHAVTTKNGLRLKKKQEPTAIMNVLADGTTTTPMPMAEMGFDPTEFDTWKATQDPTSWYEVSKEGVGHEAEQSGSDGSNRLKLKARAEDSGEAAKEQSYEPQTKPLEKLRNFLVPKKATKVESPLVAEAALFIPTEKPPGFHALKQIIVENQEQKENKPRQEVAKKVTLSKTASRVNAPLVAEAALFIPTVKPPGFVAMHQSTQTAPRLGELGNFGNLKLP